MPLPSLQVECDRAAMCRRFSAVLLPSSRMPNHAHPASNRSGLHVRRLPTFQGSVIKCRNACTYSFADSRINAPVCLYIFSPGATLELEYVAETKTLEAGGSNDLFDILVTNKATKGPNGEHIPAPTIDRIHVVYPHPLRFPRVVSAEQRDALPFKDRTFTWLNKDAIENRLYRSNDGPATAQDPDGGLLVKTSIRDPSDLKTVLQYKGFVRGTVTLTRFHPQGSDPLNDEEWGVLTLLGWSVITLHFTSPIHSEEARWLRVSGYGGIELHNSRSAWSSWYHRWADQVEDSFKVYGPLDIRDKFTLDLLSADEFHPGVIDNEKKLTLSDVSTKVIQHGLGSVGTITNVRDWRINVFWNDYTSVPSPIASGDIITDSIEHIIYHSDGTSAPCHQFKGGDKNKEPTAGGKFGITIVAVDSAPVPLVVLGVLLSVVSLVVSVLALFGFKL